MPKTTSEPRRTVWTDDDILAYVARAKFIYASDSIPLARLEALAKAGKLKQVNDKRFERVGK